MALITLVGDSDGDLHTAALHNAKFGAIASVLNGNVDHANLAYPYSVGNFNFVCDGPSIATQFYDIGATSTTGTIAANTASNTAGDCNVLKGSWIKVPQAIIVTSAIMICQETNAGGTLVSGENYEITLQKASSITGTYSSVASTNYDFFGPLTSSPVETALNLVTPAVDQNNYIRLMLKNPSTFTNPQHPNSFSILVTYKTLTVA
jgi:hypothetical protein